MTIHKTMRGRGWNAYILGHDLSDNPFPTHYKYHNVWTEGFNNAKEYCKRSLARQAKEYKENERQKDMDLIAALKSKYPEEFNS